MLPGKNVILHKKKKKKDLKFVAFFNMQPIMDFNVHGAA